jgi:polyisoprenoid-binding protein YceI
MESLMDGAANSWRRVCVITISVVLFASSNWCAGQTITGLPAAAPANAAARVTYEVGDIYLPSSRVYVFVGKTGFGHEHGVVGKLKTGRIDIAAPREAGAVEIDMTSFVADSPEARKFVGLEGQTDASTQQQVNANMLGADVLNAAQFPAARFVIHEIAKLPQPSKQGLVQYQLKGDFTLHGVSRPIEVNAEAEEQSGWLRLRGGFTMLQSQFGMVPFSKAFGAVGVTDQLTVWGDLWISKQRQVAAIPTVQR